MQNMPSVARWTGVNKYRRDNEFLFKVLTPSRRAHAEDILSRHATKRRDLPIAVFDMAMSCTELAQWGVIAFVRTSRAAAEAQEQSHHDRLHV